MEDKLLYEFMAASIENHNILAGICDESFRKIEKFGADLVKKQGKLSRKCTKNSIQIYILAVGIGVLAAHFSEKCKDLERKNREICDKFDSKSVTIDAKMLQICDEFEKLKTK